MELEFNFTAILSSNLYELFVSMEFIEILNYTIRYDTIRYDTIRYDGCMKHNN